MPKLTFPRLPDGATYSGAISNKTGDVYHLVVVALNDERLSQEDQLAWAKSIGGDLPNKLECAMLFAHNKNLFKPEAYWSNQAFIDPYDPEDDDFAWYQDFDYGYQSDFTKDSKLRGVAVRRLVF